MKNKSSDSIYYKNLRIYLKKKWVPIRCNNISRCCQFVINFAEASLFCALLFLNFSCSRPSDISLQNSSVKIRLPTTEEFKNLPTQSKMKIFSVDSPVDYNRLCFLVNATGEKITSTSTADLTCNISRGVVVGSVAPGQELSFDLSSNQLVNFEIYGYLRNNSADTCPSLTDSNWNWPLDKVYLLGSTKQVQITYPKTDVLINIDLPMTHQNIAVEKSWPKTCLPTTVQNNPLPPSGRIALGGKILTGSQFRLYGRVSNKEESKVLTGSQFKISNWKTR
jgi:hypothetical protein